MVVDLFRSTTTSTANWSGVSYSPDITFEEDASSAHVHLAADIMSITQSGGAKETEGIVAFGNKRITQQKPQDDFEIQMEVIHSDTTFDQMIFGGTLTAGAIVSGTEYKSSATNKKWRIIITWQDDTATEKLRWIFKDCYAVTWEPEHSADEYLKGTITFKVPATDKDGVANIIKEYRTSGAFTTLAAAHGGSENSYVAN